MGRETESDNEGRSQDHHNEREAYNRSGGKGGSYTTSASAYAFERRMARQATRSTEGTKHARKPGRKGG